MVSERVMKADCAFARAYFERDMLVTKPNFKLLTSVLVLLWPFGVVFPVLLSEEAMFNRKNVLQDLAVLHNPADLIDHSMADTHYRPLSAKFQFVQHGLPHFLYG
jgi:hypothetical protein